MEHPGFWLIVAMFALGLSWPLCCVGAWLVRWIDDHIAGDLIAELDEGSLR